HRGRGAEGGAEAPRHRRARPAPLIIERSQFFEVTGLHTACSRPKAGITGERKNFTSLPTGETMSLSEMSLMNRLLTGAAVAALAVTLAACSDEKKETAKAPETSQTTGETASSTPATA